MRTPLRFGPGLLLAAVLALFCPGLDHSSVFAAPGTILTVTTTADSGVGSLRDAINSGNGSPPPVTVNFAVGPFDGTVKTIAPQTPLPAITNTLVINGFSESGAGPGTLLITLDGAIVGGGVVATGLTFTVAGSVQGLTVQNFNTSGGVGVSITNGVTVSQSVISNNFIGVGCSGNANSITGNVFVLNGTPIQLFGSSNTCAANVITNNDGDGVEVLGGNNTITGSLISFNSGVGVDLNGGTNSFVSNVISSNTAAGVLIDGNNNTFSNDTVVANQADGVDIAGSGNALVNSTIVSNFSIGVNAGAAQGITNNNNIFSGDTLSANGAAGLVLDGNTNHLAASTISSNAGDGVVVSGAANIIGGPASGAGNVVIGNTGNGIKIAGANIISAEALLLTADANVVQGNFIGTDASGTNALSNAGSGILIDGTVLEASTNLIGGTSAGQGNTIAFNGSNGVTVVSNAVNNAIFGNSIFTNAVLGIDLGADGVTANHPFGVFPAGPNNFQNFPVITAATCSNNGVVIQGSITNSTGSSFAHIEFFANTDCDPSGFGQGEAFIGSTNVTVNTSGGATFSVAFANPNLVGDFITATASDSSSNTSEFSSCFRVADTVPPVISQCAAPITAPTGTNNCEATVPDFTGSVQATDNCTPTADLVITQSPTNGATASVGTNTVTITVMDQAGNSTNCTTSFIVVDTTPPSITCQADITNAVEGSQTSAVVTFPTPTATDNCSATTIVTCVPASGSIFPLGTTPVVCTAVDGAGNTASCTFTITITGPLQAIVDICPGMCPAVVNTNAGGVIQVAIVGGTAGLNISNIIPASVTLNGVLANSNSVIEDVAAPFVFTKGCSKKKDGIPDLVVEFDVNELIASLEPVKNGEVKVLTLTGTMNVIGASNTVVGTSVFEGQDKIKISTEKCKLPKGLKNPF